MFLPPVAENRATSGEWEYHTHGNKTTITKYTGYGGSVTIPYTLGGYPVTFIGDHAFRGCTGLTSVTIPDRVTSFGNYAFWDCTGLTSITIPDSVTSIGSGAFSGCTKLTSVTIGNSVTAIGAWAFEGCMGLTSITVAPGNSVYHSTGNCLIETASKTLICGCKNSVIPTDGSVTSIGDGAFSGCTGLTSITIPDSVTSIQADAFAGCTGLTSITIPDSVTSIDRGAFDGCTSLTYSTYDNAKYLGNETNPYVVLIKANSTSITSCSIHPNTKLIYHSAFCNCTSL
ncbi:MAG: leucine-rich repeat domain-containing protein, partial [Clostridia bacterium]|nr:leucine-rich repeat domain-containing protein [Clostridia bacterium]